MSSIVRTAVIAVHVALVAAFASGCAAGNNDNEAASSNADETATPAASHAIVVEGRNGGRIYFSQEDYLSDFRAMAVANGKLVSEYNCTRVGTCSYNPTMTRVSPDQTYLSDDYNAFEGPDGHRYQWLFDSQRSAWLFVDVDSNDSMDELVNAYTTDVVYNEDASAKAYELLAPLDAFIVAHTPAQ